MVVLCILGVGGLMLGPGVPPQYNPFEPLTLEEPAGPLTQFKIDRIAANPEQCFALLDRADGMLSARLLDREVSDQCHIRSHIQIRSLSDARLARVSTRCSVALRLYLWERDVVQTSAEQNLGQGISEITHFSSYSCRKIRTVAGPGQSMSAHAEARAIDISGVILDSQRELTVQSGWRHPDENVRRFWKDIRDGACDYFRAVLSPDFNALHADHFHLEEGGYRACR